MPRNIHSDVSLRPLAPNDAAGETQNAYNSVRAKIDDIYLSGEMRPELIKRHEDFIRSPLKLPRLIKERNVDVIPDAHAYLHLTLLSNSEMTTAGSDKVAAHIVKVIDTLISKDDTLNEVDILDLRECSVEMKQLAATMTQTAKSLQPMTDNTEFKNERAYAIRATAAKALVQLLAGRSTLLPIRWWWEGGEKGHTALAFLSPAMARGTCDVHIFETNGVLKQAGPIAVNDLDTERLMRCDDFTTDELANKSTQHPGMDLERQPKAFLRITLRNVVLNVSEPSFYQNGSEGLDESRLTKLLSPLEMPSDWQGNLTLDPLRHAMDEISSRWMVEPQQMQAVQKTGTCELKSRLAFLKYRLSPRLFQKIRFEMMLEAKNFVLREPSKIVSLNFTAQKRQNDEGLCDPSLLLSNMENMKKLFSRIFERCEKAEERRDQVDCFTGDL